MSLGEPPNLGLERFHEVNHCFSLLKCLPNEVIWDWKMAIRLVIYRFGKRIDLTCSPRSRPCQLANIMSWDEDVIRQSLKTLYWLEANEVLFWEPVITDQILPRLYFLPRIRSPPTYTDQIPCYGFLYGLLDTLTKVERLAKIDYSEYILDFGKTNSLKTTIINLPRVASRERTLVYMLGCRFLAASHRKTNDTVRAHAEQLGLSPDGNMALVDRAFNLGQKLLIIEQGTGSPGILLLLLDLRPELVGLQIEVAWEIKAILGVFNVFPRVTGLSHQLSPDILDYQAILKAVFNVDFS
jgi:hypothetical protein